MAEKPVGGPLDVHVAVFEGFDALFLGEAHGGHHGKRLRWDVVACGGCSFFFNSQWLINRFIGHIFKIPSHSHVSIIVPSLIQSPFGRILWDTHLQNHIK